MKMLYPNSPHTNLYSKYIKYDGIQEKETDVYTRQPFFNTRNCVIYKERSTNGSVYRILTPLNRKKRRGGLDR